MVDRMRLPSRDLLARLKQCLSGLESDTAVLKRGNDWYAQQDVPAGAAPQLTAAPYMVYLTLVEILRFGAFGPSEKTAWSIPVRFKGTQYRLVHRKFGFRVTTPLLQEDVVSTCSEMLGRLQGAIRIADGLIEPLVRERVRLGEVSVANHHHLLRGKYTYFRRKAKKAFASTPPKPRSRTGAATGGLMFMGDPFKPEREGFYNAYAMLDSYFSWLEHVLVLLLAFSGYDPETDDLEKFLRSKWRTKFNRILDPKTRPDAMRVANALDGVKERYRNSIAHGAFEKEPGSIHVHFRGVGAIPINLSRFGESIHYSLHPIPPEGFQEVCEVLDKADAFLRSGPTRLPMRWLESGLDVRFDREAMTEYRRALQSEACFDEYRDRIAELSDTYSNMDF